MIAVRLPRLASAIARFVETEDFPTPPLPEDTAITRERAKASELDEGPEPWSRERRAARWSSVIEVKSTNTLSTPSERTAAVTSSWILAFKGHPGTVSATETRTPPGSTT